MMGGMRGLFIVLLLLSASFAGLVLESGDGGTQFASDTSQAKCQEENVQAVYLCLGNVVRVVSSVPGEGSTFYKPDGKVVQCPVVSAPQMGAECLQMMMPNYCPTQAECGSAPVPQVFPGQNGSAEETGNTEYYVNESTAVTPPADELPPSEPPKPVEKPPTRLNPEQTTNEGEAPAPVPGVFENFPDYLPIVLLALGVVSVTVLFLMFKSSLNMADEKS